MKTLKVRQHIIPLWLVALFISTIGAGVLANYLWHTMNISLEVKEPIEILGYPSGFSLFPGETKEFNITVQNNAPINYSVILNFRLNDTSYQRYVAFGDEVYTVLPGEQELAAWLTVGMDAPPANVLITVTLRRGWPTPVYEDFTSFTEVDPSDHISVASPTHVDFTVDSDDEAYLYKDYGVDYFGNIEHDLDLRCVGTNLYWNVAPTWCLSNDVDDIKGLRDNGKTAICITFHRYEGAETYLRLREIYGGMNYESVPYYCFTASYGTWYYVTITKNSTTFEMRIYSDSSRSNLLATLNLTLHGDWKFRYLFVCQNFHDNTNKQHVIDIENLVLTQ